MPLSWNLIDRETVAWIDPSSLSIFIDENDFGHEND